MQIYKPCVYPRTLAKQNKEVKRPKIICDNSGAQLAQVSPIGINTGDLASFCQEKSCLCFPHVEFHTALLAGFCRRRRPRQHRRHGYRDRTAELQT